MFAIRSPHVVTMVLVTALASACGSHPAGSISALTGPTAVAANATTTGGADLQVSGSASTGSPNAGATLTYTFQLKNAGPDSAAAVTFTDVLPAGTQYLSASVPTWSGLGGPIACTAADNGSGMTVTCGLGSMAKGGQANITVAVSAPVVAGTFSNTGAAASNTADPNAANNSVTVTAQVKTSATGCSASQMISPTNGSLLPNGAVIPTAGSTASSGAVTFTWCNANADNFLTVESVPGAHDIFFAFTGGAGGGAGVNAVTLGPGCNIPSATSPTTGCIPALGETIYVTLFTLRNKANIPPSPFQYTFIAANLSAALPAATTAVGSSPSVFAFEIPAALRALR